MRLVKNPSYRHNPELIKKFNQLKDSIYQKDHSQYTEEMLDVLFFSLEEMSKIGIKSAHKQWLTKQLWKDKINSRKRVEEDYLPIVKIHFSNQKLLEPISAYSNISELNRAINNLSEDEIVSEKDYDIFYEKDGWFVAMPHTTQASCILGKNTDWCTARTKSENLFLNYVGSHHKNIVLFYVIKINGNPISNPNYKLSVGFENGKPVLDGKDGGLSVNAKNRGLTIKKLEKILGKNLAGDLLIKMDEKYQSINGKHPIKEEMKKIAQSKQKYLNKIKEFKTKEQVDEFNINLMGYTLSEEMQSFFFYNLDCAQKKTFAKDYPLTEKAQMLFLEGTFDYDFYVAQNISITEKSQFILINSRKTSVRENIGKNPAITDKVKRFILKSNDIHLKSGLAQNSTISERIQSVLVEDDSETIREYLAQNTNITKKIQIKLSEDNAFRVRQDLATNLKIIDKVQLKLAKDAYGIRSYLASNPSISEKTQLALANDDEDDIRVYLARNVSTTERVQLILVHDNCEYARINLARSTKIEKIQILLTNDPSEKVIKGLIENYNLSDKAVTILATNKSAEIRKALFSKRGLNPRIKKLINLYGL